MSKTGKRKSYRELKADPDVAAPALAWFLDRRSLYISLTLVGCLAAGGFLYQGYKAVGQIAAPAEENSPYLSIDPAQSAGAIWAEGFLSDSHGVEGWELRDTTQPSHGFIQDSTGNTAGELPITLLATRVASAGPVKAVAQVYGAGQARKQYESYVAKFAARGPAESVQASDSGILGAKFPQGFILVAGDAIVGIQATDDGLRDRLFDEYVGALESTLPESGCVDISGADGSKRSVYFDPNSFEGLQETQTLEPEVNTNYLPTLSGIGAKEIADPYAKAPEGPLPATLPAMPAEVGKPTINSAPAQIDDFSGIASYRIQDPIGPGCGWEWSAQNSLAYDEKELQAAEEDTITRVQNEVNGTAQTYVDSKISWARIVALLAPSLDNWNRYVDSANGVHGAWAKLVADRNALRPAWDSYIAAHGEWSTFDARKAAADTEYNAALSQCLADRAAHDEWEREWGPAALKKKQDDWRERYEPKQPTTPSPTPTPAPSQPTTPIPPMPTAPPEPADCPVDPRRPGILDQQKPAEPVAPAIPADVTIPDSWPKP